MHNAAPALPFRREDGSGVFPFFRSAARPRPNQDARPFHCVGGRSHRWRTAVERMFKRQTGTRVRVEYCARRGCFATREFTLEGE